MDNMLVQGYTDFGDPRPGAPLPRVRYWIRTAFLIAVNAATVGLLVGAGRYGYAVAERLLGL